MNIEIPINLHGDQERIPGMWHMDKPLPLTIKRLNLYNKLGQKFIFIPSIANLQEMNSVLKKSFTGYLLFTFPENRIIYMLSPSDEETAALFKLFAEGDGYVAKALTEQYFQKAKKIIPGYIIGDGEPITRLDWDAAE